MEGLRTFRGEPGVRARHRRLPGRQRVILDAEHYFDGFRNDPASRARGAWAAAEAGATTLVLCDTNGGTLPTERKVVARTVREFPTWM